MKRNTHIQENEDVRNGRLAIYELFNRQYDYFRELERGNSVMLLESGMSESAQCRAFRAAGFRSLHWMLWAMRKGRTNQEYVIKGKRQLATIPTIRLIALAAYWGLSLEELASIGRASLAAEQSGERAA